MLQYIAFIVTFLVIKVTLLTLYCNFNNKKSYNMFPKYSSRIKGPVLKKYRTPTQNTGPSRPQCSVDLMVGGWRKLHRRISWCDGMMVVLRLMIDDEDWMIEDV